MTFRAVRLNSPGRPLADERVADTAPGAGEILVRVKAAGICHSDAHYRAGVGSTRHPLTLGHEISGVIEAVGAGVTTRRAGDRVCLHYLVTCGGCSDCRAGREQFCATGQMIGKDRDGGFAEFIRVPAGNAHDLPDAIPFEQGAILMCSSATALHALRKARVAPGDAVAVFGIGGLGVSAIQLARALGAAKVYAVDVNAAKLALAQRLGAIPIDARTSNPVQAIREATEELTISSRRFLPLCASWVNRDKCFHHALLGMPCCNTPSPPRLPENSIPIAKANFEKGGDDAPRRTLCTVQNAR